VDQFAHLFCCSPLKIHKTTDVRKHANPNTSIMVLGNKNDLDSKRQVSREEAERFAKENDLFYLETSAKAANNVEEAFVKTTEDIYHKIKAGIFDVSNQVSYNFAATK
jgi:GTPase SAR1 family protein